MATPLASLNWTGTSDKAAAAGREWGGRRGGPVAWLCAGPAATSASGVGSSGEGARRQSARSAEDAAGGGYRVRGGCDAARDTAAIGARSAVL